MVQQHSHIHIRIAVCRGAVYGREEEGERRREGRTEGGGGRKGGEEDPEGR